MADKLYLGNDSGNEGDLNVAANWDPVGVPIAGDDVYFQDSAQAITASLNVWAAVALGSVHFCRSYTGLVGDGDEYLELGLTQVIIGEHYGSGAPLGSGRLRVGLGANASSLLVLHTAATAQDEYRRPLEVLANDPAAVLEVRGGIVGVGDRPGETGELLSVRMPPSSSGYGDGDVVVGQSMVLAEAEVEAGLLVLRGLGLSGSAPAIVQSDGVCRTAGELAVTSWTITGGSAFPEATGLLSLLAAQGGNIDFTRSREARTVAALELYRGANVRLDPSVVTVTALSIAELLALNAS